MKEIRILERQIDEMQQYVLHLQLKKEIVSKANVGWHLSHSAKVIETIIHQLRRSDPADYRSTANFRRWLVFSTRRIPRGKAKSPSSVLPDKDLTPQKLQAQLDRINNTSEEIEKLPENAFFNHPYFDHLTKRQSVKFLTIHTEHHLKIIRDIHK